MLDDFVRGDGSKIYRVAFWAKHAAGQTQSLWRFMLGPSDGHTSTFSETIVCRTREKARCDSSTLLFDAGDPNSLELIDPEVDRVDEEVKVRGRRSGSRRWRRLRGAM